MRITLLFPNKIQCVFCHDTISNESEIIRCATCASPHHGDCWKQHQHCAVYGCRSQKSVSFNLKYSQTIARPARCRECNRQIDEKNPEIKIDSNYEGIIPDICACMICVNSIIDRVTDYMEKYPQFKSERRMSHLADMYLGVGNKKKAVEIISNLAENYDKKSFFLRAIALYKTLLKIEPDNIAMRARLAQIYERQGMKAEANILLREDSKE